MGGLFRRFRGGAGRRRRRRCRRHPGRKNEPLWPQVRLPKPFVGGGGENPLHLSSFCSFYTRCTGAKSRARKEKGEKCVKMLGIDVSHQKALGGKIRANIHALERSSGFFFFLFFPGALRTPASHVRTRTFIFPTRSPRHESGFPAPLPTRTRSRICYNLRAAGSGWFFFTFVSSPAPGRQLSPTFRVLLIPQTPSRKCCLYIQGLF